MRLDIILKVKNLICVNHIDSATNYNFICNLSTFLFIVCMCVLEVNLYSYIYIYIWVRTVAIIYLCRSEINFGSLFFAFTGERIELKSIVYGSKHFSAHIYLVCPSLFQILMILKYFIILELHINIGVMIKSSSCLPIESSCIPCHYYFLLFTEST